MLRSVAFALALLMATPALSREQSPQTRSTANEHGYANPTSEDHPLFVVAVPKPKSAEETAKDTKSENEKSDIEKALVRYTCLLFWATAALAAGTGALVFVGFKQVNDAKDSIAAAVASADAAKISAETTRVLERPYVYGAVSESNIKDSWNGTILTRPDPAGTISIYNFGRTIAQLTRVHRFFVVCKKDEPPAPIDPKIVGGRELPVGTISATGDPFVEVAEMGFSVRDYFEGVAIGDDVVWLVGYVRYDDIFGVHHVSGFAQTFDPESGRFYRRGGDAYNYSRTEKLNEIPSPEI